MTWTRDILVAGMLNSADTYVDHSWILAAEIRRDNEDITNASATHSHPIYLPFLLSRQAFRIMCNI